MRTDRLVAVVRSADTAGRLALRDEGGVRAEVDLRAPSPPPRCGPGAKDYFSTLGHRPGIAALVAGLLSPVATIVLVIVTLAGALPVYRRVTEESPHGEGSIAMLSRLLSFWKGKLFVLTLLGFAAADFLITITLSAADASTHLVENPHLESALHDKQVIITLILIALLGAVFLKGFLEAIGVAVALVGVYLALNAVVVVTGLWHVATEGHVVTDWTAALTQEHGNVFVMIGVAPIVFPKLALGLSGFETGDGGHAAREGRPGRRGDEAHRPDPRHQGAPDDGRDMTGARPHVYFEWTEGNPFADFLRFFLFGQGEIAPVTREILREAESDRDRRPRVHVGQSARRPVKEAASQVDARDAAVGVAGEEAALACEDALGEDVLVAVSGQEAHGGGGDVRRHVRVRGPADLRLDLHGEGEPLPVGGDVGGDVEVHGVDPVTPGDLAGAGPVVRHGLGVLLDQAEEVREGGADDGLVEEVALLAVGEGHDGEVVLGREVQLGVLSVAGSAVADGADAVDGTAEPADAEAVAHRAAAQRRRLVAHAVQGGGAQQAVAVAQVEAGPGEEVGRGGGDAAAGVVAAGAGAEGLPGPGGLQFAVLAVDVARGERPDHDVVHVEDGVREAERLQDESGHGLLEGPAGDVLDDPPGQVVAGLAVGGAGAGRGDQREAVELGDERGEGAVLALRVDEVPVEARGVVEQVEDGDPGGNLLVGEDELGHVAPDRRVEVDPALLDQAEQGGRGEGLRDRRQVEDGVLVDRARVGKARDPVVHEGRPAADQNADGCAGHAVLLGEGRDDRGELVLAVPLVLLVVLVLLHDGFPLGLRFGPGSNTSSLN